MAESVGTTKPRMRRVSAVMLGGGALLISLIVIGVAGVQVWEYSNSVAFCSNTCHDVHPEEPAAYQDSYHARVKCTECHMGRVSALQAVALKSSHARHLPAVLLGDYGRPLESESMRPANETCERCHTPTSFHDDTARSIRHFSPDEFNTEKRTYLLIRTGAGTVEAAQSHGIHWHISNPVEYIATGDQKQEILWVRVSRPDGQIVEYSDALNPLSPEEVDRSDKRLMDCVDCHNRIGHPYQSPEKLIDKALAEGRLSPDLPFVKKEMLSLLSAEYATQDEALAATSSLRTRYRQAYPQVAFAYATEVEQAVRLAEEMVPRLVFEEPGVTWQSFSDNIGHINSPGCFRCHDGKHVSQEGEVIRLKCSLCHSIPETAEANAGPPEMPIASRQEPASHLETTFIADHRSMADDSCVACHGAIDFGDDDTSFCANSACHGRSWPMVDLDTLFEHPIKLEGGHAGVQCQSCHDGSSDVSFACATCHEAPAEPHYGALCQDCHMAVDFRTASADGFLHPLPLRGRHEVLDCSSCHVDARDLSSECSSCHTAPSNHLAGTCDACHTPAGWLETMEGVLSGGPPVPHAAAAPDDCLVCHDAAGQNWPAPPSHAAFTGGQCQLCHEIGSGNPIQISHAQVADLMQGSHAQAGCVGCHTAGSFRDTPTSCIACHEDQDIHVERLDDNCARCHAPIGWSEVAYDHTEATFQLLGQHQAVACTQCHANDAYAGTPQTCIACHQADDRHAGQLGPDCAQCHTPERWQGASVDHNLTAYPLTGRHLETACAQCHGSDTYTGTPQTCIACHQADDLHAGQFGADCAQCHTPDGWQGASIDHNLTAFPLTGRHMEAACSQCHANNSYAGTPQTCIACHQADDLHAGQFGADCAQCHTPERWQGASIDHNLTAFPLTGQHTEAACDQCHANSSYAGTPQTCIACHQADDRHAGQFGADCAQCHTPEGWLGANLDHNLTAFPLTGRHMEAACSQCHPSNSYAGTPVTCSACHDEPAFHAGLLGTSCADCHGPDGWHRASFGGPHTFPINHARDASCRTCHPETLAGYDCSSCHASREVDEEHHEEGKRNYADCVACHPTGDDD